jgi:hypothetical protein
LFIKAKVRGGYRAAATYLEAQGKNEYTRLVYISDLDARNLDEAFQNMWEVANPTKADKPLFHFSINPYKEERLTDKQVKRIIEAYAAKCKMDINNHQHVIVEHVLNGRQHFHVFLNRVSLETNKAIDPGLYKKKAKECAREMEVELGLKRFTPSLRIRKPKRLKPITDDTFEPTTKKKTKTGKGDGAGGGVGKILSAFKATQQEIAMRPFWKEPSDKGLGNGPERRRRNLWVPVERREQKPKR